MPAAVSLAEGVVVGVKAAVVTLAAGVATQIVAANSRRRYLMVMNIGAAPMTVVPDNQSVTAGQGMNFDPPSSTLNQGGGFTFEAVVSRQAFTAISTGGTTVCVWEG